MRVDFIHCHGSGNDFPLIDARAMQLDPAAWASIARQLADRSGPVGGDGILLLKQGIENAPFSMSMLNADGSEAETCLNGLRCVARLGFERLGLAAATVRLKTSLAVVEREAEVAPGVYTVRETAGPASLDVAAWPMRAGVDRLIEAPLPPLGSDRLVTAIAMPNPHLVSFVDRIDEGELTELGARCEAAPAWLPNRANVSFVEQRGPAALFVRTFERGVGLTDSCGSAMAAATVAACLTGRAAWDAALTVYNKGGLVGTRAGEDGMVSLSGNATWQYQGSVEVDLATGTARDLVIERRFDDETAAWDALVRQARSASEG